MALTGTINQSPTGTTKRRAPNGIIDNVCDRRPEAGGGRSGFACNDAGYLHVRQMR